MEREAKSILRQEGFSPAGQTHKRSVAARYRGQSFELEIKTESSDIARQFHRAHRLRYGYADEMNEVEIVSARLRSSGLIKALARRRLAKSRHRLRADEIVSAYFNGKKLKTAVYRREEFAAGARFDGPAIVREYSGTTLLPPQTKCLVDDYGNLIIET
jgi:N-methylhydantoinase A